MPPKRQTAPRPPATPSPASEPTPSPATPPPVDTFPPEVFEDVAILDPDGPGHPDELEALAEAQPPAALVVYSRTELENLVRQYQLELVQMECVIDSIDAQARHLQALTHHQRCTPQWTRVIALRIRRLVLEAPHRQRGEGRAL